MLITSLFYSKLYYGSEVWHLPERTAEQNKMIKFASANSLRTITKEITIYHSHTEIHQMTKRALPDQMIKYKHALMMYKLFRQCTPENEFIKLNFQANLNQRLQHHTFIKMQNYNVSSITTINYSRSGSVFIYKFKCSKSGLLHLRSRKCLSYIQQQQQLQQQRQQQQQQQHSSLFNPSVHQFINSSIHQKLSK